MRTQYDTLMSSGRKAQKPSWNPLCVILSTVAICALLATAYLAGPSAMPSGVMSLLKSGNDVAPSDGSARVVVYFSANDVLDTEAQPEAVSASITHLILTDFDKVEDDRLAETRDRISRLQEDGVAILLSVSDEKQAQLRSDFPTYHAELNAAITNWNADGVEVSGTDDLMRLVSAIRTDCDKPPGPSEFIVTVRAGAHQVFGSDHQSRQVLRNLVLQQELGDAVDWIDVMFDSAWTEEFAQKIVNSMESHSYDPNTIVPIMNYDANEKSLDVMPCYRRGCSGIGLDELLERFGMNFGGFGMASAPRQIWCPPCGISCCP